MTHLRLDALFAGLRFCRYATALTICLLAALPVAAADAAPERQYFKLPEMQALDLPFSDAVLVGDTLYISGHLGRDPETTELVTGGLEAETRQALANIRSVLQAADMDFGNVVTVTAFITDVADFPEFNAVYREYFPEDPPARATVHEGRNQRPRSHQGGCCQGP